MEEDELQGKFIQRMEEEEDLQMKPIQRMEEDELQGKFIQRAEAPAPKTNNTGLPDNLKSGIENLSGMSMDHVKVHRNSDKPAQVQAHAYAQGSEIHLAPGQEKHLPHEAWHVVQQAQGRVKPTMQMKGVAVNDDVGLETEADVMGARALSQGQSEMGAIPSKGKNPQPLPANQERVAQRLVGFEFETKWDLRKPGDVDWDSDTKLVSGPGWQMSPDEISGNRAKIEFKTDPFNVDGPDTKTLSTPIVLTFGAIRSFIEDSLLTFDNGDFTNLGNHTNFPAYNTVAVRPNGPITAKPQATGGVRVDLILDFLKDMASSDNSVDLLPHPSAKTELQNSINYIEPKTPQDNVMAKKLAGVIALLGDLVARFQSGKTRYDHLEGILRERIRGKYRTFLEGGERSELEKTAKKDELQLEYDARNAALLNRLRPSYAKANAPALARIAFNDLPHIEFAHLEKHVLLAAGLTEGDGGLRMFPLGLKVAEDLEETISEWIESIQQDRGETEGENWSARALETVDVGHGDKRDTGIPFELRGLKGPLPYQDWFEFAKPFLAYFRELNTRDKTVDN